MKEIHDNLLPIEFPFFTIFDWIIMGSFFAGVLFLLLNFLQKPKKSLHKKLVARKIKKIIPPTFNLEKNIEQLKKEAKQKHWKNFSLLATQTLKNLCEQKFKKSFAFATSYEMKEILIEKISDTELQKIQKFFRSLDPIKFAKSEGQEEVVEEVLQVLRGVLK